MTLYYLVIILGGLFILALAFVAKLNLSKKKKQLSLDEIVVETKKEQKEKKPIEIEAILMQNNFLIKVFHNLDKNVQVKFTAIAVCVVLLILFNRGTPISDLAVPIIGILIGFIFLPSFIAGILIKGRIKMIMNDLPGFIDLVAVNLQLGISLEGALKQVAQDFEHLNKDLSDLILRVMRKSEVIGLEASLMELSVSLPTTEIKMFCTVMLQSINFGSSIYHHLIQLSADIRDLQILAIEEKLGSLAAKMSIPLIVFIMFPIVILIIAPGAMRAFPSL